MLPDLFGGAGLIEADIEPVLLHGDLWSGNYAATDDGTPCIYDPASYVCESLSNSAILLSLHTHSPAHLLLFVTSIHRLTSILSPD
jgi:fructosamine-3-kinase